MTVEGLERLTFKWKVAGLNPETGLPCLLPAACTHPAPSVRVITNRTGQTERLFFSFFMSPAMRQTSRSLRVQI